MVSVKKIKHTQPRPKGFLSVREVSRCMGCGVMSIRIWIDKQVITAAQVQRIESETGPRIYVAAQWVEAELNRQRVDLSLRQQLLEGLKA